MTIGSHGPYGRTKLVVIRGKEEIKHAPAVMCDTATDASYDEGTVAHCYKA